MTISPLQKARYAYRPLLPAVLKKCGPAADAVAGSPTAAYADQAAIRALFPRTYGLPLIEFQPGRNIRLPPLKVGVILSGGQAPGGHNVIAGLYDALQAAHPRSALYGFLGGPSGLLKNAYQRLNAAIVNAHRNTGGFDMLGSGRTKLENAEQFDLVAANCGALGLRALVVIGGDDSNTNAGVLAEYFLMKGIALQIIGCPKTIDGDLKNEQLEISFGFDTATKLYSELIGNIARDANSARKYWHFIKLMGRSASHVTLECALQTQPNAALISEEAAEKGQTLKSIVDSIAAVVRDRAAAGMNFGVVLVPEGLVEFIPEIKTLIAELNDLLAHEEQAFNALAAEAERFAFVQARLAPEAQAAFASLPRPIQAQLLAERDSHGQVQVSKIETEKLLMDMVGDRLQAWAQTGAYADTFSAQNHFLGYEGRCAPPSNFDANYGYTLGYTAAALIAAGKTGYLAAVGKLAKPVAAWTAGGIPLTMMMNIERRKGKDVPVIRKALVDLAGKPFRYFAQRRDTWARTTAYRYPGPIQYFGPADICDRITKTLELESR